ncbi:alpha-amylase family glycosyl hydrolase [Planococcus sp. 107-1]|uniref:alpha-amylase family glycosyl hydrolase n=1 Tax=Planococcus sp. 107-1 TaxID=2908840 RepID=UPI001F3F76ED|nr:alpha-amylase family glycosyl hydrolase [Planococcus sp. 107-1]UJF25511.1 hypothetical protein L0M13_09530 [Planococcus sp. 107-1]
MKLKWISVVLIGVLLFSLVTSTAAAEKQALQDEIIYDLLVDRFFNKGIQNDIQVDSLNPNAFSGGDFAGLSSEMQYIKDMGFTMVSIGPVFSANSYDGKEVLDYQQLEPRFGTEEEWQEVIEKVHELDMKITIDLPTQRVSNDHMWRESNPEWFSENGDGTVALDTSNPEVQDQLIDRFSTFVSKYKIDGIRLQTADELDPFLSNGFLKKSKVFVTFIY